MIDTTTTGKVPYRVLFKPKNKHCRWHHITIYAKTGGEAIQTAKKVLQYSKELSNTPKDISNLDFIAVTNKFYSKPSTNSQITTKDD
jgi:hypothetical protein